jgi:CHAT domain-containing protein
VGELAQVEAELAELEPQVQAALAEYNQLIDAPVTADAVQALLGPGEALLDILVGTDATWLFLVRQGSVRAVRRPAAAGDVDALVRRVRRSLELDAGGFLQPFDLPAARSLHEILVVPVAADLDGLRRLVVVPSGSLTSIPFEILAETVPDRLPDAFDYGGVTWLGERLALAVVPSARSFVDLRAVARPSAAALPFIGFGDFVPGTPPAATADVGGCVDSQVARAGLAALPETAGEVRAVAGLVGGADAAVVGAGFTEARLGELALDRYRIVYFATHGLLPGETGCLEEPALVVSAPAGAPAGRSPGLLDATEIAALRLDADLVVLSACNTAGADGTLGGESLSGLARSFFFAGARTLLVSHWNVPSEETVALMTRAFAALGPQPRADAVADALKAARLDILARGRAAGRGAGPGREAFWTHPFFWGAFSVVGGSAAPGPA